MLAVHGLTSLIAIALVAVPIPTLGQPVTALSWLRLMLMSIFLPMMWSAAGPVSGLFAYGPRLIRRFCSRPAYIIVCVVAGLLGVAPATFYWVDLVVLPISDAANHVYSKGMECLIVQVPAAYLATLVCGLAFNLCADPLAKSEEPGHA